MFSIGNKIIFSNILLVIISEVYVESAKHSRVAPSPTILPREQAALISEVIFWIFNIEKNKTIKNRNYIKILEYDTPVLYLQI